MNKRCKQSGKRCYASEAEVKKIMRQLSAALRFYRCSFCNYLHLTKGRGDER